MFSWAAASTPASSGWRSGGARVWRRQSRGRLQLRAGGPAGLAPHGASGAGGEDAAIYLTSGALKRPTKYISL